MALTYAETTVIPAHAGIQLSWLIERHSVQTMFIYLSERGLSLLFYLV